MRKHLFDETREVAVSRARVFLSEIDAYFKSNLKPGDVEFGVTNAIDGLHKLGWTDEAIARELGVAFSDFQRNLAFSKA